MIHASIFSGIGGPEIAAAMLGWQNAFHCEINDFCRKILEYHFPNSTSYDDIKKTDFTPWRGRINVLTGGFPCQPFSYAGQRKGATDDRYLWPYMFRCIDQIQPDWVVAENVAGILTMVEQGEVTPMGGQADLFDAGNDIRGYRLRETFTLQRICDDLEGHGYSVQPVLIPACAVGAPHRRDRVFIIGHRNATDTADARAKSMRRERQDAVHGCGTTADTDSMGRIGRRSKTDRGQQDNMGQELLAEPERPSRCATPTDTAGSGEGVPGTSGSTQSHGSDTHQQQWSDRFYAILRHATDTAEQSSERLRPQQSRLGEPQSRQLGGGDSQDGSIAGCGRWQGFPTVSPVHRGNDGLPFDVDDLTIPFTNWRTESIKAYGNAIAPQVMYEIFRAIQLIENQQIKS